MSASMERRVAELVGTAMATTWPALTWGQLGDAVSAAITAFRVAGRRDAGPVEWHDAVRTELAKVLGEPAVTA